MSSKNLFRGMTPSGTWVEGDLVTVSPYSFIVEARYTNGKDIDPCLRLDRWEKVLPHTVGQYIGREDINGKKIFEDDRVKGKHTTDVYVRHQKIESIENEWYGVVKWQKSTCSFVVQESPCRAREMLDCHEYEVDYTMNDKEE